MSPTRRAGNRRVCGLIFLLINSSSCLRFCESDYEVHYLRLALKKLFPIQNMPGVALQLAGLILQLQSQNWQAQIFNPNRGPAFV
jgi:hypothetical protein